MAKPRAAQAGKAVPSLTQKALALAGKPAGSGGMGRPALAAPVAIDLSFGAAAAPTAAAGAGARARLMNDVKSRVKSAVKKSEGKRA